MVFLLRCDLLNCVFGVLFVCVSCFRLWRGSVYEFCVETTLSGVCGF